MSWTTIAIAAGVALAVVLLLARRGGGASGDGWAPFFSERELADFEQAVRDHFAEQGLDVIVEGGVVRPADVRSLPGDMGQFGLMNVAQVCKMAGPEHWPEVIREHFDTFARDREISEKIDREMADLDAIRPHLAVHLYPAGSLPPEAEVLSRTDLDGTLTVMVLDLPSTIRTLKPEEAAPWGKDPDELFAMGLENVLAQDEPELRSIDAGDGLSLTVLTGPSHYVADRVLAFEAIPGAVGRHGSLVSIPHRHMMLIYPIDGVEVVRALNLLLPMTRNVHAEGPRSLSPNVYWFTVGRFVNLPYRVEGKKLQLMPPPDFTALLEQLAQP